MCGFTAYVGTNAREYARSVVQMADRLRHRGPDDSGQYVAGAVALAHRRLSIVDVGGGKQPLLNEDGCAALVCNGEIYNHRVLRADLERRHRFRTQSDSEVILHLYEEQGPSCVRDLDGMFSFVVTDRGRFLAARDPLGIKPLYFGHDDDGGIWFASELKSLPTFCREVAELPPGSLLTEQGVVRRWFVPTWIAPPAVPVAATPRVLARKLAVAVTKRLMSDVPIGVLLSGGLDSSVIAALVHRRIPGLQSFAVGIDGAPDLAAARRVAEHLGTRHHEYVYSAEEAARALPTVIAHLESYDPALIRSAIPCYMVSKLAARYVKVVLTGEGADEIFAGYRYFGNIQDPDALHAECVRLLLGLHNMNLQRVDRMTMAHGLEGRVPFLDVDFLAWAMALDPVAKSHRIDRSEKWLLRQAFAGLLPPEIVGRSKQEFAEGAGSEGVMRAHCDQVVTDADFARADRLFPTDPPTSKEAFLYRRIFDEHFPGEARRKIVGRWRGFATPTDSNHGEER